MNEIKEILQREIDILNCNEQRDNTPRFSLNFLKSHPFLWLSMYICYVLSVGLIFTTDYLGWPAFWGATIFIVLMTFLMLLDIKPKYRFKDIDALDLRVCYNGEWFYIRTLSDSATEAILLHPATPEKVKIGIQRLLSVKGEVDFYDVYSLTWGQTRAGTV